MTAKASAAHTALTPRNFAGFAAMMLLIEFMIVGMGAIDLLMIAPLGLQHIAALGLGDLIAIALFAFFTGLVHAYASQLALAEGQGTVAKRLPDLAAAALVILLGFQVVALGLALLAEPALHLLGQDQHVIPGASAYLETRLSGVIPAITASAMAATLRICGARRQSIIVLGAGFGANALFNYVLLYTEAASIFESPERAVAVATILAQALMIPVGYTFLRSILRKRGEPLARISGSGVSVEVRGLAPTACGVGGRNINDYMSATLPILFIGTLGAQFLAATVVASKLYTLYCRLPQSAFEAAFVFYGYVGGEQRSRLVSVAGRLTKYCATVTFTSTLAVLFATPWLIQMFSGDGLDQELARLMFYAYMLSIPFYFADQLLARFLVVHGQGGILFGTSLLTYLVALPLASVAVFVYESAFWAIASRGVVFAISGILLWMALRRSWTRADSMDNVIANG